MDVILDLRACPKMMLLNVIVLGSVYILFTSLFLEIAFSPKCIKTSDHISSSAWHLTVSVFSHAQDLSVDFKSVGLRS